MIFQDGTTVFGHRPGRSVQTVFLFSVLLTFFLSFAHTSFALITYDSSALFKIRNHLPHLFFNALSTASTWPMKILHVANGDNGYAHAAPRRRRKKHSGKCAGVGNRLRTRAHSPLLSSILITNVQSLENKMDDLRARIRFQRDIRDCNILCLSETWLTPSVPNTAVTPSDNFSSDFCSSDGQDCWGW